MKEKIKHIIKNNKTVLNTISFIYSLFHGNINVHILSMNTFKTRGVFFKKSNFKISGKSNQIIIGELSRIINCTFTILGDNCKIIIGGGSTIISNVHFWCQDDNSSIIIGEDFTMEGGHIAATEGQNIRIGNDCMFSGNIEIRNGDSHSIIDKNTGLRVNHARSVDIGNHVWLAANVVVLKGAKIADHSIIGNSSVVTGNLDETNSIYSGMPCKLIKKDIDWDRNKI